MPLYAGSSYPVGLDPCIWHRGQEENWEEPDVQGHQQTRPCSGKPRRSGQHQACPSFPLCTQERGGEGKGRHSGRAAGGMCQGGIAPAMLAPPQAQIGLQGHHNSHSYSKWLLGTL